MTIKYLDNEGKEIEPDWRKEEFGQGTGVIISNYEEAKNVKYRSEKWMAWWNFNKDREEIKEARRKRDKRHYQKYKQQKKEMRVIRYHKSNPSARYYGQTSSSIK